MRQGYRQQMEQHQLRREIVVTQIVNQLVNNAGITYFHRLSGETNATTAELTKANFVAREIFGAGSLQRAISAFDNKIDAEVQTHMRLESRTLVERASRWLLNSRTSDDTESVVNTFEVVVEKVMAELPSLLIGQELWAFEQRRDALVQKGVPEDLAVRVAVCPPAYMILGMVETAARGERDPMDVARVHFEVGEMLGLPLLVSRILALPREDRWQTMARAALRDDLHAVHAQLTAAQLAGHPPPEKESAQAVRTLQEICSDDDTDLARLSVALRVVRTLL
jgi:glutamate dehydrogenase